MLGRETRGEKILHDLIRRMGLVQEELAQAKSQLTRDEQGSHSREEFASIRKQLQETRVELGVIRDQCDRAQAAVARMARKLTI